MKRVLKWDVPVDDKAHPIGTGPVVHVDCQHEDPAVVQVWTEEPADGHGPERRLAQVVATGMPYPDHGQHIGTAKVYAGRIMWHVVVL